jgi:hypothetical protein
MILLFTVASCSSRGSKGAAGSKGEHGQRGKVGATGEQGTDGVPGLNGLRGLPGINGSDGLNGEQGADAPTTTSASPTGPENTHYLIKSDELILSLVQLPTSNVDGSSTTIASTYLYGRSNLYDLDSVKVGTYSATFIALQDSNGIYVDISNSLVTDGGVVFNWQTTEPIANLELSTIVDAIKSDRSLTIDSSISSTVYFGQRYDLSFSGTGSDIVFNIHRRG